VVRMRRSSRITHQMSTPAGADAEPDSALPRPLRHPWLILAFTPI